MSDTAITAPTVQSLRPTRFPYPRSSITAKRTVALEPMQSLMPDARIPAVKILTVMIIVGEINHSAAWLRTQSAQVTLPCLAPGPVTDIAEAALLAADGSGTRMVRTAPFRTCRH